MIKTTRWSPDTCECVFEYTWDSDLSETNRSHTLAAVLSTCDAHKTDLDADKYTKALNENIGKNQAINHIAKNIAGFSKKDPNDIDVPDFDKISFSFDADRKLILSVSGAQGTKNSVQSSLDGTFGTGKIQVA